MARRQRRGELRSEARKKCNEGSAVGETTPTERGMEPEQENITRTRKKKGGNSKVKYLEGWIEFDKKSEAKMCALALNNQLIGGKKRHNLYRDDTWNLKYLSKFQWNNLTEKLAYD